MFIERAIPKKLRFAPEERNACCLSLLRSEENSIKLRGTINISPRWGEATKSCGLAPLLAGKMPALPVTRKCREPYRPGPCLPDLCSRLRQAAREAFVAHASTKLG